MIRIRLACAPVVLAAAGWSGAGRGWTPPLELPGMFPDPWSEAMGGAPAPLTLGPYAAWSNPGGLGLSAGLQAAATGGKFFDGAVRLQSHSILLGSPPAGIRTPLAGLPLRLALDYSDTHLDSGSGYYAYLEEAHGGALGLGLGDYLGFGAGAEWVHYRWQPPGATSVEFGTVPAWSYGAVARLPLELSRIPHGRRIGLVRGDRDHLLRFTPSIGVSWTGQEHIFQPELKLSGGLRGRRHDAAGVDLELFPVRGRSRSPLHRLIEGAHVISAAVALGRTVGAGVAGSDDHLGLELKMLGILSARWGHADQGDFAFGGNTYGFGVSILGYVGVDRAVLSPDRAGEWSSLWSGWIRVPLGGGR